MTLYRGLSSETGRYSTVGGALDVEEKQKSYPSLLVVWQARGTLGWRGVGVE